MWRGSVQYLILHMPLIIRNISMNFIVHNMISIDLLLLFSLFSWNRRHSKAQRHTLHYLCINMFMIGLNDKKQITQQKALQFLSTLDKYNTAFCLLSLHFPFFILLFLVEKLWNLLDTPCLTLNWVQLEPSWWTHCWICLPQSHILDAGE